LGLIEIFLANQNTKIVACGLLCPKSIKRKPETCSSDIFRLHQVASKREHYHQEAVSIPNGLPSSRTIWDVCGLTMSGDNRPRCFTDSASTDERLDSRGTNRHHWDL